MWDRRTLKESSPEPVGTFAGHLDGITYIDSKVGEQGLLYYGTSMQEMSCFDNNMFIDSWYIQNVCPIQCSKERK